MEIRVKKLIIINFLEFIEVAKSYTKLLYYIPFDVAVLLGEVEAYADNLLAVELERERIVAVFNLLQSLLSGAVQLEFHHVAILRRLQHQVYAAAAGAVLGLHIEAHQLGHYPHHVLIVVLQVFDQLVGRVGKEAAQPLKELLCAASTDILDEMLNAECCLRAFQRGVIGHQIVDKA